MNNPYPEYINLLPRSFTYKGRQQAMEVHNRALLLLEEKPKIALKAEYAAFCSMIMSSLRKKEWHSTDQMGPMTEATGILTEIAFSRFFNESASHFVSQFEANLGGDPGYERMLGHYRVDDKGTAHKDKIFTISERAAKSCPANIYTLGTVEYKPDGSVVVTLEGWCWVADAKPWIREQKREGKKSRYRLNLWILKREGILQPMETIFNLLSKG